MMKKLGVSVSLTAALLLAAPAANAQLIKDNGKGVQRWDVFVGYSYNRADVGQGHGDLTGGGIVSGAYHFNRWLAGVAEWSTHHDDIKGTNVDSNLFLFGPRAYFLRTKYLDAFGHGLFGFHNTQVGFPTLGQRGTDDTGFAFAAGVGADVDVHRRFSIRAIQVDYLTTDLNLPTQFGRTDQFTDNIRLSTGIVFKFGRQ